MPTRCAHGWKPLKGGKHSGQTRPGGLIAWEGLKRCEPTKFLPVPMNDKPKKPQKLKARLPRGLEDRGPAAISATRQMVEKIREVYERYGFEPVETPAMEYLSLIHI